MRVIAVPPHTVGWLKRADLGPGVWEMPDGTLILFKKWEQPTAFLYIEDNNKPSQRS